ncbi:putative Late nodulin [Medicago truncatula]|uniref:Nodule Cysteine-Rich (NCR) secreted peptide n=1 Tax=Medicago truncatula TaxID=3880 RepID=I3S7Z9_MEDTR|nr:unknown [Medicago truncatula]KEH40443.1 Nodule Cysteine-Rich (NCR) secreted peptide [Medicago truncatula]RHN77854.1 putative Late nodulin [Medicago truncatula]
MSQIRVFVYALIIFLSQFLVVTSTTTFPCVSDDDCPVPLPPPFAKCVDGICEFFIKAQVEK